MSIITFINEKGGVGKTSVCFNVAWELSKRGQKILMIDRKFSAQVPGEVCPVSQYDY